MKSESVAGVKPEIFRWARKSVGLTVTDVADMLKRRPEEVEAWEDGSAAPTYPQLEKLAYQIYKRPLAIFFLPSPPEESLPQREFRTLPDADLQTLQHDTYLHIRRAHAYQLALRELFDGNNPADQQIWKVAPLSPSKSITPPSSSHSRALGHHTGATSCLENRRASPQGMAKCHRGLRHLRFQGRVQTEGNLRLLPDR